jgi:Tol biopolymer transport system component
MRKLLLAAVLVAVTPGAATSAAHRPQLTYAVAPIYFRGDRISLGLCATDLAGHTFRLTDPGDYDSQSWSPDGSLLAFSGPAHDGERPRSLYVTHARGGDPLDLTPGLEGAAASPFGWSPDGSELGLNDAGLFDIHFYSDVFVAKSDGSGNRGIVSAEGDQYYESVRGDSWSPDGSRILLSRTHVGNPVPAVSVIDADGRNERKLLDAADLAIWSPDGQQFAYYAYPDWPRATGLGVARADGSDARLLVQGVRLLGRPTWSPDGSRIAYVESSGGKTGSLGVVRADGTDARLLTDGVFGAPQWSPDGSLIAFTRGSQRAPEVAVIKPDGSGLSEVAAGLEPVWRAPSALPSHRRPCILHGTSRADVIHGTRSGDVIFAGRGADRVYGGGGPDVIVGGLGPDRLYGGRGPDLFDARDKARDYIDGGSGNDGAWVDQLLDLSPRVERIR